jgi:hypothetical protein
MQLPRIEPIEIEGGGAREVEVIIHFAEMPHTIELGKRHKLFPRFGIQGDWMCVAFDWTEKTVRFMRA